MSAADRPGGSLPAPLAEIRAITDAATPGPWTYGDIDSVAGGTIYDRDVMVASIFWDNDEDRIDPRIRRRQPPEQADANGAFIAAAREYVPVLLACVEAVLAIHGGEDGYCYSCGCNTPCATSTAITITAHLEEA